MASPDHASVLACPSGPRKSATSLRSPRPETWSHKPRHSDEYLTSAVRRRRDRKPCLFVQGGSARRNPLHGRSLRPVRRTHHTRCDHAASAVGRTGGASNLGRKPEAKTGSALQPRSWRLCRLKPTPLGRGHEPPIAQQGGKPAPPENKLSAPAFAACRRDTIPYPA